jgi:hypothetical protein
VAQQGGIAMRRVAAEISCDCERSLSITKQQSTIARPHDEERKQHNQARKGAQATWRQKQLGKSRRKQKKRSEGGTQARKERRKQKTTRNGEQKREKRM